MKAVKTLIVVLLLPFFLIAQGVKFENNMSWAQIKEKARKENKNIFIDMFATWCGPCKMMDTQIYPDVELGKYVNTHFISVKVQGDKTDRDNLQVMSWYKDMDSLVKKYNVTAYPTFLFFSSNGELTFKESGYKSRSQFQDIIEQAVDYKQNFIGLSASFTRGQLSPEKIRKLALMALKNNDLEIANRAAQAYKSYLDNSKVEIQSNEKNIEFIKSFPQLLHVNDPYFTLFYQKPEIADSSLNEKGISQLFTDYTLNKDIVFKYTGEIMDRRLGIDNIPDIDTPNWNKIRAEISLVTDDQTSDRLTLNAKLRWAKYKKDWAQLVKLNILKVEQAPIDTSAIGKILINNMIFEVIFTHGTEKKDLQKGIDWMRKLLHYSPEDCNFLDTYANLLYKAGHIKQGIKIEKQAIQIIKKKKSDLPINTFKNTLEKMKKKQPTWITSSSDIANK